jgi:hypothetical protein
VVAAAAASIVTVALHGLVTVGPATCPTAAPCAKPAAHMLLIFSRQPSVRNGSVAMVWTDGRGRYSTKLLTGTWTVQAVRTLGTSPGKVSVRPAKSLTVNFRLTV